MALGWRGDRRFSCPAALPHTWSGKFHLLLPRPTSTAFLFPFILDHFLFAPFEVQHLYHVIFYKTATQSWCQQCEDIWNILTWRCSWSPREVGQVSNTALPFSRAAQERLTESGHLLFTSRSVAASGRRCAAYSPNPANHGDPCSEQNIRGILCLRLI